MSDYRQWFVPDSTFFITAVTYDHRPILTTDAGRMFLRNAIQSVRQDLPFNLIATVLLPDHWHLVMQLPEGDQRYKVRLNQIQAEFSEQWIDVGLPEATVTESERQQGQRGIWQPKFRERIVRDEADLQSCADYIHWNPRQHKLVQHVVDWKWSSFHRFVDLGLCKTDWPTIPPTPTDEGDWCEPE